MGQLATDLRLQISQSTMLQTSVGVCDVFHVMPSQNALLLKEHLTMFTQDNKPMLGNPAHPRLFFDECTQLIVPFQIADHDAVAVIKLGITSKSRQANIDYFDSSGSDLNTDHLAVLIAFFTENQYSVNYRCVSELIQKKGISQRLVTGYKALDLANSNAGISTNLFAKLLAQAEEKPVEPTKPVAEAKPIETTKPVVEVKPIEATQPAEKPSDPAVRPTTPKASTRLRWVGSGLAVFIASGVYMKYDLLKDGLFYLAALLPANPLYAFMACGGVFFGAWLLVAALGYLLEKSDSATLDKRLLTSDLEKSEVELTHHRSLLNAFTQQQENNSRGLAVESANSLTPIKRRSLS